MASTLTEIAEHIDALKEALDEWPTLRPFLTSLLCNGTEPAKPSRKIARKGRRKMNAAQLAANSKRMKARWKAAKKAGRTTL